MIVTGKLVELAVSLAVTTGAAVTAYAAVDVPAVTATTTAVAQATTCRTVTAAAIAYAAEHDTAPVAIIELRPYLSGDLTGYQLIDGLPSGPGCPT
jgi:hypothetical protein